LYFRLVVQDASPGRKTPAWLWVLFIAGRAVFALGSFIARVDGHLYGVPILTVGLAVVVTFVAGTPARGDERGTSIDSPPGNSSACGPPVQARE
jgi:hypothetical protein